jgi:hypothetical protein
LSQVCSLATFTIVGSLLAVGFGHSLAQLAKTHDLGAIVVVGIMIGLPTLFIAFCYGDMLIFFRRPRVSDHRRLPDKLEIEPDAADAANLDASRPKKDNRFADRAHWLHTRWIGPSGYR